MKRPSLIILCVAISAAALGCAAYVRLTNTVPLILFFVPTGTVVRDGFPWLFWMFVSSHVLVGIISLLAVWVFVSKSRKSR